MPGFPLAMTMPPFEDGRCYSCGKHWLSRVGVLPPEARCRDCQAPICRICWDARRDRCAAHRLPDTEQSVAPARAESRPAPAGAVSRAEAQQRERDFLARVERSVQAQRTLRHASEGRSYETDDREVHASESAAEDVRRLIRAAGVGHPREVYDSMPLNRQWSLTVAAKSLLGRRTNRVTVTALCGSPLSDLVGQGWSDRLLDGREAAATIARLTADATVFHWIAACSTVGWSADADRLLDGGPNFCTGLVSCTAGRWSVRTGADPRWNQAAGLFRLHGEEEENARVAQFVAAHSFELIMGLLTDRWVAEQTGVEIGAVRTAFESLCRQDPFVRGEISGDGFRLTRIY